MNENLSLAQAERKHLKGLEIIAHAEHFKLHSLNFIH